MSPVFTGAVIFNKVGYDVYLSIDETWMQKVGLSVDYCYTNVALTFRHMLKVG